MLRAWTLTTPAGLFVLALLGPLFLLYVMRAKRTRRVVSSVWLWRAAQRDLRSERRFRRLIPVLPLLIESVSVVALALAAAGPVRKGSLGATDDIAIVVDTSASMGATDGTRTRFSRAVEAAKGILRQLGGRGAIVVDAAREPHAASGVERDPDRLGRVLDALAPRDEGADLSAAVVLAEERLNALPGSHRVVVITDPNSDVPVRSRLPLEVIRVGALADNAAVARLELRRTTPPGATRDRVDALVVVQSFSGAAMERFVSLSRRGGEPFASRRVALAPRERTTALLSFDASDADTGAGIVAELSPGDALASDDRAFALVPPGPRLPVVVAAKATDPWLARALLADPSLDVREAPLPVPPGALPPGALLIAVGACADAPNGGDVMIVAPPAGACFGVHVGEIVKGPRITSWSDGDPRFRFVSFDDVHVLEGRKLDAPRSASLLRAGDATLITDLALFGRTGTLVGFDWAASDWPMRASFVLFVRNVTELARADRARALGTTGRTGEPLRITAPVADRTRVTLRGPAGELAARVLGGAVIGETPSHSGFYDTLSGGKVVATAAVNTADPTESDLRHAPGNAAAGTRAVAARAAVPPIAPLSPWLAVVGALGAAAEAAWLFRRPKAPGGRGERAAVLVLATMMVVASGLWGYAYLVRNTAHPGPLSFERPAYLALPVLLLGAGLFATVRRRNGGPRRAFVEGFVALAALAAALCAAGPALRWGVDRLAVLVAVDRSRSIDLVPDAAARVDHALEDAARTMRPRDALGVVAFASEAALEEPLRSPDEPRLPQQAALGRDGTDLAAGIRRALGEAPPDSAARIVLVSDGLATRGDTLGAAAAAALAGVPVDVLSLEQTPHPSVRVESVRAPARAAAGETIDVRVTVRSTLETEGNVVLTVDGERKDAGRTKLHAGEDVLFLRAHAEKPGLHQYEVRVEPTTPRADSVSDDNAQTAFVRVTGRARALIVDQDEGHAEPLRTALEAAAFDVDVTTATRAPSGAGELLRDDLVVLGNVPARDLSPDQLEQTAAYVEQLGGGLLLMGGKSAMGPGGYTGTPIEEVSPVSFELRNERRRARLAEVIAIDYSGSMAMSVGAHTKLELANEAAARSADLLGSLDRLGVLHVDTTAAWTVPLTPLTDKADVARRIRAVGPGGGGIFVDRALEVAYAALDRENVEQKHVLLFSDGDDAEQRQNAPSLARAARRKKITTSVVALGRGQDVGGLEQLSREGEGRFYLIEDAARLPAVFAEETTIAAGSAFSDEPFRAAAATPIAATRGVDLAEAPPLGGYTVTTAKPRAEVALVAAERNPLLATWSAGTGHAAAFTSDYSEPWGTAWRGWPGAARLFAQLARSLARGGDDPTVTVEASATGGRLRVAASAVGPDGSLDAMRTLTAHVVGPDGFVRTLPLEATSPGAYGADVPVDRAGTYLVEVSDEATHTGAGTAGAVFSKGDELTPAETDHALLARVAELSGGRVRTSLAGIFADRPDSRQSYRPLSAWLAAIAALAMLLSAAARRLPAIALPRRAAPLPAEPMPATRLHESPSTDVGETGPLAVPDQQKITRPDPGPHKAEPPPTTAEILLSRRRRRK